MGIAERVGVAGVEGEHAFTRCGAGAADRHRHRAPKRAAVTERVIEIESRVRVDDGLSRCRHPSTETLAKWNARIRGNRGVACLVPDDERIGRSEERRVGKEGREGWSRWH